MNCSAVTWSSQEQFCSGVFISARAPSERQTPPRTRSWRCS